MRRTFDNGYSVAAFDPLANEAAKSELSEGVEIFETLEGCVANADLVIVCTPDVEFSDSVAEWISVLSKPCTLIDFWRCVPFEKWDNPNVRYVPMGQCLDDSQATKGISRIWAG